VQLRASFVAEAGVKMLDPSDLTLTFQQHEDLTRTRFENLQPTVKTHSLGTTEKLLDHLHTNKLVRFIHQAARHTDMAADGKTLCGATLDDIVENLALEPSPAKTESFQPMFTSLLTKLKAHRVSGTISAAPVSFNKTAFRHVSNEHNKRPERLLARGSDGGSGDDARGGGRGKGPGAKTTGPKFKPTKGTPCRKVSIADNNNVCSHGHFTCDCSHRKSNAAAAQKKRDAAWAEENKAQTRKLKEIV